MINNWIEPQIEYLLILQNVRELTNGIFDNFFIFLTSFGEINIPVMSICLIYWCINKKYGKYILWSLCFGYFISQIVKIWACIYRPWILNPKVTPVETAMKMAGGYSFPSSHTQTAVCVWGGFAVCFKNSKFLKFSMIFLIILVAFSRNYLGVHTPQDVIFSLISGIFILFAVKKIIIWIEKEKNRDIYLYFIIVTSCIILAIYSFLKTYPEDYINGVILVDPAKMKMYTFPSICFILGSFSGSILENRLIKFRAEIGSKKEKFYRFIIGTGLLIFIKILINVLFSQIFTKSIIIGITAFLSTIFITYIYPLIIIEYNKKYKYNNDNKC